MTATSTPPRPPLTGLLAVPFVLAFAACGSGTSDAPASGTDAAPDAGEDSMYLGDATPNSDATKDDADAELPSMLSVRIRATTATFNHADGLAGQTPITAAGGIRSLSLLRDQNDTAPAVLFEYGEEVEEASFDNGDDTLVGAIPIADVAPGHYQLARLVQAYSRYSVAATMHDGATATPGQLDNVLVMGDGTTVDGQPHDAGYYHYVFQAAGQAPQSFEGEDAVIPAYSTTAGAAAVVENGQWAVYFPINLDWSSGLQAPVELVVTVNMFESFRWTDVAAPGYLPGVFDITPISYEPVVRFGGNEFIATVE